MNLEEKKVNRANSLEKENRIENLKKILNDLIFILLQS
jgi:hypothetical protein